MKPTKYVAGVFHEVIGLHFDERDALIVQRVIEENQFLSVAKEFGLSTSQVSNIFYRKVGAMRSLSRALKNREEEVTALRSSSGRHPIDCMRNKYPMSVRRFLSKMEGISGIYPATWEQAFSMASMMHRDAKVIAFVDYAKNQMK